MAGSGPARLPRLSAVLAGGDAPIDAPTGLSRGRSGRQLLVDLLDHVASQAPVRRDPQRRAKVGPGFKRSGLSQTAPMMAVPASVPTPGSNNCARR